VRMLDLNLKKKRCRASISFLASFENSLEMDSMPCFRSSASSSLSISMDDSSCTKAAKEMGTGLSYSAVKAGAASGRTFTHVVDALEEQFEKGGVGLAAVVLAAFDGQEIELDDGENSQRYRLQRRRGHGDRHGRAQRWYSRQVIHSLGLQ
jgi:hypothetical protein